MSDLTPEERYSIDDDWREEMIAADERCQERIRTAIAAERKACRNAICPLCREGNWEFNPSNGFHHRREPDGRLAINVCKAAAIREREETT